MTTATLTETVTSRQRFLNPRIELSLVLSGLYSGIVLYYTRRLPLQMAGVLILFLATLYWSYAIHFGEKMTLSGFGLTRKRLGLYIALGAVIGTLSSRLFSEYVGVTRGEQLSLQVGNSVPVILSILAIAVSEDLFFRGYLLTRLRHFSSRWWVRVLLASCFMAVYKNAVHIWEGEPLIYYLELFATTMFNSVPALIWVEWTGSIATPMTSHFVWDLLVYSYSSDLPFWAL